MKNNFWISLVAAVALVSCRTPMGIANVQTHKNIEISHTLPSDADTEQVIVPYKNMLEAQMNTKISHTNVDLTKIGDNSNLGNLLADYTLQGAREWAKNNQIPEVQAAVINIGGIRTNIGKGDILLKHIYEVMPFENEVVLMKMSGKDVQSLFDYYLQTQKNNPVSGIILETDSGKIIQALIGGERINPEKNYYIATSDYLAFGGDNMKFFSKGEMISTGIKLRDLFIEKFKQNPEIAAPTDIRLIFNGKTKK